MGRVYVCEGPPEGICSVDKLGCGYCIGVPCKYPKKSKQKEKGTK